jgi:hypothetical protein
MARGSEVKDIHTQLLRCTLEIDSARAWWGLDDDGGADVALRAFDGSWFGPRSLPRVRVLLTNMRARFGAFPEALQVLRSWSHMEPQTRALLCHWHVQLTDPMYRAFAGVFLVERHDRGRPEVTRDQVTQWVSEQGRGRWTLKTRIQFASQLLVTAKAAGLVKNLKDPRQLQFPRVDDEALTYLLYLLRGVDFEGSLLNNPYLASVGLSPRIASERFRALTALRFRQQADLVDFGWVFDGLSSWAAAAGHSVGAGPKGERGAA